MHVVQVWEGLTVDHAATPVKVIGIAQAIHRQPSQHLLCTLCLEVSVVNASEAQQHHIEGQLPELAALLGMLSQRRNCFRNRTWVRVPPTAKRSRMEQPPETSGK